MMRPTSFALTGRQHQRLRAHLFPGDGLEAVAFALCGRRHGAADDGLLVREIIEVPYADCPVREGDRVTWRTELLPPLLDRARAAHLALVKVHSHPAYYPQFSLIDDASDDRLFHHVETWIGDGLLHGSVVMLPDGTLFGRLVAAQGRFVPFDRIRLVGDDIRFWPGDAAQTSASTAAPFARRVVQTFGKATYQRLRGLRIGVIGCSGTGSLVIEQLARNCVGELVLVDPKAVEDRNLNRITQATADDAAHKRLKVDVMERAINAMGLGVRVVKHAGTIHDPAVLRDLAACDVIFGCMDTVDGRHTLNRLAAHYLLPYFDVGVKLVADGKGGIDIVVGTVHYLQPDGSSLLSRHVYTMDQAAAAALHRQNPAEYAERRKQGYIVGVNEDRPAVISVNMLYASLAVNEFLARLHPYRIAENGDSAVHSLSLSHGVYSREEDGEPCSLMAKLAGRGDVVPMLGLQELHEELPQ